MALANGIPALRVDSNGDLYDCATTHHDFATAVRNLSLLITKTPPPPTEADKMVAAMFGIPVESQHDRFLKIAQKYGDLCIKRQIDSTDQWTYSFELSGWRYSAREWLRPGEKSNTTWNLVKSQLRKRPEFRKCTEQYRLDYYHWLKSNAADPTRRYERPYRGERKTIRSKSRVNSDRDAWVIGKI